MAGVAAFTVAGAIYYFKQQKAVQDPDDFDDDEDDDLFADLDIDDTERSYVSLHPVSKTADALAQDEAAENTDSKIVDFAEKVEEKFEDMADAPAVTTETIEEFFDEDDADASDDELDSID
jgi:mannitol-1-phosphate/altronate dehydrogenase